MYQAMTGIQLLNSNTPKTTLEVLVIPAFICVPICLFIQFCLWGDLVLYFQAGFILLCEIKKDCVSCIFYSSLWRKLNRLKFCLLYFQECQFVFAFLTLLCSYLKNKNWQLIYLYKVFLLMVYILQFPVCPCCNLKLAS